MKSKITILILLVIFFSLVGIGLAFIENHIENDDVTLANKNDEDKPSSKEEAILNKELSSDETLDKNVVDSFTYGPLPEVIVNKIDGVSWKKEAPVEINDLSYVKVLYWGFDEKEHTGELIVNNKLAEEITQIFKELYEAKFPIEKIRLIDEYDANDDLSMEDNNTSAFCFREVAGKKGTLSKHSYGIAIDINPIQNPYIKGEKISPAAGLEYIDRENARKGMIVKNDICYKAFKERGWTWGGEWKTIKDYQHFQKVIDLKEE